MIPIFHGEHPEFHEVESDRKEKAYSYQIKGYCSYYKPLLQCIIDACDVIHEIASTSSERLYTIICESKCYSICREQKALSILYLCKGYYTCAINKRVKVIMCCNKL
jgi:hypothetical protein